MRQSYFLVVLLLFFAACVSGLVDNNNAAQIANFETTSDDSIVSSSGNLKGSSTTTADEERGAFAKIGEFLSKSTSFSKFFGKSTATQVETLGKNTKLVDSIRGDATLQRLGSAVSKSKGTLTEKKVGKIGEFIAKLKKIEYVGDVKGMRIAYGILFLAIFGIIGTGIYMTRNVENSYIH